MPVLVGLEPRCLPELVAEAVLMLRMECTIEELIKTIHAHPTLSEALHEAALAADKKAIDFPNK